ncbi:MAG: hypothetical protein U0790_16165 [Isosphaeraceae bacterium]
MHDATLAHAQAPIDDPATSRVLALVERLGGEAQWDEKAPGRRLIGARLGTTRITDEQLGELAAVPSLRHLELILTRITDAGLARLRGHDGLRDLYLYHTRITDAGFEHLAAIPKLEDLMLGPCAMTAKGLARLQSARHLKTLKIYEIELTDSMLAAVGRLGQLEQLDFYDVGLTDARLAHLNGLRGLRRLSLDNNLITDAGLAQLAGLTRLESLGLEGTKVTDAGLVHLKNLTRLRTLRHADTRITSAGLGLLPQLDRGPGASVVAGLPGPRPSPRDRAAVAFKDASTAQIREAVRRAVGPLQATLAVYSEKRDCYACHHQGVPLIALAHARSRGVPIDEEVFDAAVSHTRADLESALELYRKGRGQAGGATQVGYALWTLELGGQAADGLTSVVTRYLETTDRDLGHWKPLARRPPMEASRFTTTAVALRSLKVFGPDRPEGARAARIAQALDWLRHSQPVDTEDRVFRLWGLKFAGAKPEEIRAAASELLATQQGDGGWSQTDELGSDAYATGTALVSLHDAGAIPTDDPAYRRGTAFLVATQKEDGTWYVASRSEPVQVYFESGFPYGKDQFISAAATGWAAAALSLALPVK